MFFGNLKKVDYKFLSFSIIRMGFCLSKCVTGIDHVYDPSQDNNRVISNNNLFVVRPPCDRSIKIHTDIENICRICFCEEENQMLESFVIVKAL